MKKVLVLGAGMVAKPFVEEMLEQGFQTTCVDVEIARAEAMIENHPLGKALSEDIRNQETLDELIGANDLVASLLPPPFHPMVAKRCLAKKKNMVTTSYLTEELRALSTDVEEAGLIFLNETGLDPGIDHMTVMELKDEVIADGGKIVGFQSHCGGFPSRKAATNPIRYKFSWNPGGVLGALTRDSSFMLNGLEHVVPGEQMLSQSRPILVPGEGIYEVTPNGNASYYADKYGLQDCHSVLRGTLRYPGWAHFWTFVQQFGWLNKERKIDVENLSPIQLFQSLSPWDESLNFMEFIKQSRPKTASLILEIFESLGFFDEDATLNGSYSAFDVFLEKTQENWLYAEDEVDKVVLFNRFDVEKNGNTKAWTSILSQEGTPGGHSAMSLLVGLPCAIGATLILQNQIHSKGVRIPLNKEIYGPILNGLKAKGIQFEKRISP